MGFISIVKTVTALVSLPSLFLGEDKISVALLPVSISAQGASTGAIKLWDLEEAKIVRTLTGHRINCTAIEFHPFG
ncbi:PREDICTED: katanin p80 WD40 repeat-containing subunit B1 homolog [Nelumbo nucifera]|uniref:Katanin p80 WD40 repeat-containing subunit B1 homolog n=1 Tax=Nelumbo nucifera TaxID=4432 RepID=A0A1U8Q4L5_NELNU|nr:PREDICTED: katanin p80 WD40 repeat-containing subunit B1 homolog [Nelumbo nucifera]